MDGRRKYPSPTSLYGHRSGDWSVWICEGHGRGRKPTEVSCCVDCFCLPTLILVFFGEGSFYSAVGQPYEEGRSLELRRGVRTVWYVNGESPFGWWILNYVSIGYLHTGHLPPGGIPPSACSKLHGKGGWIGVGWLLRGCIYYYYYFKRVHFVLYLITSSVAFFCIVFERCVYVIVTCYALHVRACLCYA